MFSTEKFLVIYTGVPAQSTAPVKYDLQGDCEMEKHTYLFEKFATFDNLYDGYLLARRKKRYKSEVLAYSANLEENIINDMNRLQWKMYKPGPLHQFYEYFPKKRIIHSQQFADRVVNCAAYNVLWPIYSRSFYEHSYGSIPNKGPEKAVANLQNWMRIISNKPGQWYIVKLDVAKFFFRVPLEVQLRELGRPIDDPNMMWFLETAIRCDDRPFGLPLHCTDVTTAERVSGIGMQVGSLISQMTANVVLTPLDHYIKRELKVPYYMRYMDDMMCLVPSKEQAWETAWAADDFMREHLGLQLNEKTAVIPVGHETEFIGRIVSPQRITIRKSTTLQMKRHITYIMEHYSTGELSMEYCLNVLASYMGMLKHSDCEALRNKILQDFKLVRHYSEENK